MGLTFLTLHLNFCIYTNTENAGRKTMPVGQDFITLKFVGVQGNEWGVSALIVTAAGQAAPTVTAAGKAASVEKLMDLPISGNTVWRCGISIALSAKAQNISYAVNGKSATISVPVVGAMPCMAYASCNGFSSPGLMKKITDKNALWKRLTALHTKRELTRDQAHGPFHVLLMGGDQIYSDAIWVLCPSLKAWCELTLAERTKSPFSAAMKAEVTAFFENTYLERWAQPEVAAMMASVPSIMMWDDHDIFDGWGSYPNDLHYSDVYQGIYAIAKDYFSIFQQHSAPGTVPPCCMSGQDAYTNTYNIGGLALLALDMRSERQPELKRGAQYWPEQVVSQKSWGAVFAWLSDMESPATAPKHLMVMTSIPVVHPDFNLIEKLMSVLPGQQEIEDDLRDHWTSTPHRQERLRFIKRLLEFSAKSGCRVTLVSGDVHVAAVGVIESDRNDVAPNARVINQLTSSGIVHPSPPGMALFFLEQVSANIETVDRGITAQMYEFPATNNRFIGARNVLTIEPDDVSRLWANWWVEGEPNPYTKVIHPVQMTTLDNFVEPSSVPQ
jgi:PhoD related phosphatase